MSNLPCAKIDLQTNLYYNDMVHSSTSMLNEAVSMLISFLLHIITLYSSICNLLTPNICLVTLIQHYCHGVHNFTLVLLLS